MIKRTLYFGNPAYLSLRLHQLVVKLPAVERSAQLSEGFKREAETSIPIEGCVRTCQRYDLKPIHNMLAMV